MREKMVSELSEKLRELGKEVGLNEFIIQSDIAIDKVYVKDKHALMIMFDWRDRFVGLYVVYLKDGKIPQYAVDSYPDGHWCIEPIMSIYHRPYPLKNKKDRFKISTDEELYERFYFSYQLVKDNPEVLRTFLENMD